MPHRDELLAKAKNPKQTYSRIIKEFKPQIAVLIVLVVLLFVGAALYITNPIILQSIIKGIGKYISNDGVTNHVDWSGLLGAFGIMLAFAVGSSLLTFISDWIGNTMVDVYSYHLRSRLKSKLNKMPLSYFDGQNYGEILSKLTNDIDNMNRNLYSIMSQVVQGVALLVGTTVAMFVTSWQLALVVLASYPLMAFSVAIIAKQSKKQYKRYREQYGKLEGMVEEDYAGYKIVKLFCEEESSQKDF